MSTIDSQVLSSSHLAAREGTGREDVFEAKTADIGCNFVGMATGMVASCPVAELISA
mgnify:CR=1 FL=1